MTSNINANDDMRGRIKQTLYLNEADFEQGMSVTSNNEDFIGSKEPVILSCDLTGPLTRPMKFYQVTA